MCALAEANRVRLHRANVKLAPEVVFDDPDCATMAVSAVLLAMPKIGRTKACRVLARAGVSSTRTIGELTARQRECVLAGLLGALPAGEAERLAA